MAEELFQSEKLLNMSVGHINSQNNHNNHGDLPGNDMPYTYSPRDIIFIVTLTVILVVIVAIVTFLSIVLSNRRSADSDSQSLTNPDYARTSEVPEIWSVEGAYNPIDT